MNILHIISGGESGGSKNHLLALAEGMGERSIKTIIVCFIEGKLYQEAKDKGLDIRLIKQNKRFDLSVVKKIVDICSDEKIDIINCHGARANFIGAFLKRRFSAAYATTVHSDYNDDYKGNRYKTIFYSNINKIALKSFDCYITVSDNFKDMLISRGFDEHRVSVVYNGIDFKKMPYIESKQSIMNKNNFNEKLKYAVIVGRFHPVKGHKVFIDAAKIVCQKTEDTGFILVGDGDIKNEIEQYVKATGFEDRFYLTGWKEPWEFLSICEFSVMASFTESFPLAILESAKFEKPVISTRVGGIDKLIHDGVNGYLVEVGDSCTMAERMMELFDKQDECVNMGQLLYKRAREQYSVENMVDSYIKIYCKIVGGNVNA